MLHHFQNGIQITLTEISNIYEKCQLIMPISNRLQSKMNQLFQSFLLKFFLTLLFIEQFYKVLFRVFLFLMSHHYIIFALKLTILIQTLKYFCYFLLFSFMCYLSFYQHVQRILSLHFKRLRSAVGTPRTKISNMLRADYLSAYGTTHRFPTSFITYNTLSHRLNIIEFKIVSVLENILYLQLQQYSTCFIKIVPQLKILFSVINIVAFLIGITFDLIKKSMYQFVTIQSSGNQFHITLYTLINIKYKLLQYIPIFIYNLIEEFTKISKKRRQKSFIYFIIFYSANLYEHNGIECFLKYYKDDKFCIIKYILYLDSQKMQKEVYPEYQQLESVINKYKTNLLQRFHNRQQALVKQLQDQAIKLKQQISFYTKETSKENIDRLISIKRQQKQNQRLNYEVQWRGLTQKLKKLQEEQKQLIDKNKQAQFDVKSLKLKIKQLQNSNRQLLNKISALKKNQETQNAFITQNNHKKLGISIRTVRKNQSFEKKKQEKCYQSLLKNLVDVNLRNQKFHLMRSTMKNGENKENIMRVKSVNQKLKRQSEPNKVQVKQTNNSYEELMKFLAREDVRDKIFDILRKGQKKK